MSFYIRLIHLFLHLIIIFLDYFAKKQFYLYIFISYIYFIYYFLLLSNKGNNETLDHNCIHIIYNLSYFNICI